MNYNCFDVAKKFLQLAKEEEISVSPMKLLKLTYIAHGYHLGFFDKALFENKIQAWKYGPVIPELYHVIKRFGQRAVDEETVSLYSEKKVDIETANFLKVIWNHYKEFSGSELSSKTHLPGTPWDEIYTGHHFKEIDNDTIRNYYKKMLDEKREKARAS